MEHDKGCSRVTAEMENDNGAMQEKLTELEDKRAYINYSLDKKNEGRDQNKYTFDNLHVFYFYFVPHEKHTKHSM